MSSAVVHLPPDASTGRRWTGRDVLGYRVVRIPWDRSPITVALFWKKDSASRPYFVGCYRIDLERLCKEGYAYFNEAGDVVLRFQRTGASIEIAINRSKPGLYVGRNPLV